MKKLIDVIDVTATLLLATLMMGAGVASIVGGVTGVLWY